MGLQPTIMEVAKAARQKCLHFAMSKDSDGRDYHQQDDLSTMCAVASTVLATMLRETGVDSKAKVVEGTLDGDDHCWVLSRGFVVDITASQFGDKWPYVVVLEKSKAHNWRAKKSGSPGTIAMDWGEGQAPLIGVIQNVFKVQSSCA